MMLDKLFLGTYSPNRWRLTDSGFGAMFGRKTSAGMDVDEDKALSLSAVFAGVRFLSQTIGALPLAVMKNTGDRKEHATTHPAYRLLHTRPNPYMTAMSCRSALEWSRLMYGRACAEIGWGLNGKPAALWPIEGYRVQVKYDDEESPYYLVDGKTRVSSDDMLYIPMVSTDGVEGRGFIEWACESLGLGLSQQEFAARFFGNGGKPGGVLKHPGTPKKEARDEFRKSWQEIHGGPANANKTAVVWGGWEYQPSDGSVAPDDAQLLDSRRFHTEEVARWLNLPPHILRDLSRATFSNIAHQGIELVVYTLNATLVAYEQEYDVKLLDPPTLYSKHNVAALMRGDPQSRAQFYKDMTAIGAFNINDVLDLEDMNGIGPMGELRLVQTNLQPLEAAMRLKEEPKLEPAPAAPPVSEEKPDEEPEEEKPNIEAQSVLIAETMKRMLKIEQLEAIRAAKHADKFLTWMDEFYPKHKARMVEALAPVLEVCGGNGLERATLMATTRTEKSYQQFLDLSDKHTPATFAGAVEAMVATWEVELCHG